jgi:hypothetical protein
VDPRFAESGHALGFPRSKEHLGNFNHREIIVKSSEVIFTYWFPWASFPWQLIAWKSTKCLEISHLLAISYTTTLIAIIRVASIVIFLKWLCPFELHSYSTSHQTTLLYRGRYCPAKILIQELKVESVFLMRSASEIALLQKLNFELIWCITELYVITYRITYFAISVVAGAPERVWLWNLTFQAAKLILTCMHMFDNCHYPRQTQQNTLRFIYN